MADRLQTTGIGAPSGPSARFDETVVGGEEIERIEEPHPAGSKLGRYLILERVGQGGMGVVYAAFDPELNRRVALKILHGSASGPTHHSGSARARLLREAQAIARVTHPNVISVYDVGTLGASVFVAMEYVDGPTLTQWQAERRELAQILTMYLQAARGLAAAHAAGIVHRDFKPDNVLIGGDGHARVLDFGLARTDPSVSGGAPDPDLEIDLVAAASAIDLERSDVLSSPLTMAGAVVGTPRFMAPEQHAGVSADARSDQFSYCVALYQAVYRQDPFSASNLERLALAKQLGQIRRPPPESRVPMHVADVIQRGLATDPAERWPDMAALIAALERDPVAARRRVLRMAGIAAIAAVATGAAMHFADTGAAICEGGEQSAVWDDGRRTEIARALAATGVPYAEQARVAVERGIDAYVLAWSQMQREACEAARVRGEQSESLFDRRMRCLEQRRDALAAVLDVLAEADAEVVQRAVQAVGSLPAIESCGNVEYLLAVIEPPPGELAVAVTEVRERLTQAAALAVAGRVKPAATLLGTAQIEAERIGYAPLRAEVLARLGATEELLGDYVSSEAHLHEALEVALASRHDEIAAQAASTLVSVVGDRLARHAEGLAWARLTRSLLQRLALAGMAAARLDVAEGNVLYRMGDLEAARVSYERAIATLEQERGPDDPAMSSFLANLGNVHYLAHRRELALATFERAAELAEKSFGPQHPNTATSYFGLANVLTDLGRFDEAEARLEQAREILRVSYGEDHPYTIGVTCNLGVVEQGRDRHDRALAYFRECRDRRARTVGTDHPDYALAQFNVGRAHLELGELDAARAPLEAALAIRARVLGPDHVDSIHAVLELAQLARALGDRPQALARFGDAIAAFERADVDPLGLAAARFGYARTLVEQSGPSERALALAEQARSAYAADRLGNADALRELDAWLATARTR